MSTSLLLILAASMLLIPRLLGPRSNPQREVHGGLRILWWLNRFLCGFWHRLELGNEAPLPAHGPAILISNHTCGIDNFVLQAGCDRVLGFVIVQEWFDHWLCHPFCKLIRAIPVRRDGRDSTAVRTALRELEQGRVVPIFPEGRINPDSGRSFTEPMPGAAFIALRSNAPVIPAYISGTPPTRNIWKAIYTPSASRLVFGVPIDLSEFRGRVDRASLAEVSVRFMEAIRDLSGLEAESAPPSPTVPDQESAAAIESPGQLVT